MDRYIAVVVAINSMHSADVRICQSNPMGNIPRLHEGQDMFPMLGITHSPITLANFSSINVVFMEKNAEKKKKITLSPKSVVRVGSTQPDELTSISPDNE
jgi:hypothetical protein